MARIYLTGSGQTKGHATGSGVISNPVRILLQEKDNHTGSYPTIARTGDPDFTGRYQSFYDDTNTVNFVGNSQTLFPMNLPASSKWVSGNVATPNILQGLTTFGTASKGVSDVHVSFTPGQNISPFNESRIYIDNNSSFYRTGTSTSILENFDQRLSSKAIITIDVNPTSRTDFFFSTGSTVSGRSVNSGIGYYSWTEKKWHLIRSSGTGSNVDYVNPSAAIRSATPHAFTSRAEFYSYAEGLSNVEDTAPHIGIPHSTCGFPFATQFDATGSQLLHLTSSISGPFLVEKISMEFSASFPAFLDSTSFSSFAEGPNVYQFFLMRVGRQPVNFTVDIFQDLTGSSTGVSSNTRVNTFTVNQYKDLIWTGEIARFDNKTAQPSQWYRDLNLSGALNVAGISAITGTYRVEAPCRVFGSTTGLLTTPIRATGSNPEEKVPLLANRLGGRNFAGIAEGRSFIRSVAGTISSGSIFVDDSSQQQSWNYQIPRIVNIRFDSPYVLMPNDDLVLGFANQSIISGGPTAAGYVDYTEDKIAQQVVTLVPGAGKLTLFGSLLRNNLPVSSEINQPLTSDAIHEDLHYDNPVFDQFDVEPFYALTGSYVDLIITGSMLVTPFGNTNATNVRKVQASAAAGQAGSTGSLQRFVNLISESDLHYDSIIPNPVQLYKLAGGTDPTTILFVGDALVFENPSSAAGVRTARNYGRSFPFEGKYGSASRIANIQSLQSLSGSLANSFSGLVAYGSSDINDFKFYCDLDSDGSTLLPITVDQVVQVFFGAGPYAGFPDLELSSGSPAAGKPLRSSIRGFRYGLMNYVKNNSSAKFRRDRYGQFRDMLEQSPNAAYLVANSVEYPVEIKFFSRPSKDGTVPRLIITDPSKTYSQNLSTFATSSLPYFDGVAKERTDDPDVVLAPIEVK